MYNLTHFKYNFGNYQYMKNNFHRYMNLKKNYTLENLKDNLIVVIYRNFSIMYVKNHIKGK
jgi:hypothetical protein